MKLEICPLVSPPVIAPIANMEANTEYCTDTEDIKNLAMEIEFLEGVFNRLFSSPYGVLQLFWVLYSSLFEALLPKI